MKPYVIWSNGDEVGCIRMDGSDFPVEPVVRFFGGGSAYWLLTEFDPDTGMAFGLADLGCPEMGAIYMPELINLGSIERDLHWKSDGRSLLEHWKGER